MTASILSPAEGKINSTAPEAFGRTPPSLTGTHLAGLSPAFLVECREAALRTGRASIVRLVEDALAWGIPDRLDPEYGCRAPHYVFADSSSETLTLLYGFQPRRWHDAPAPVVTLEEPGETIGKPALLFPLSSDPRVNAAIRLLGGQRPNAAVRRYRVPLLSAACSVLLASRTAPAVTDGWLLEQPYAYDAPAWAALLAELKRQRARFLAREERAELWHWDDRRIAK